MKRWFEETSVHSIVTVVTIRGANWFFLCGEPLRLWAV